MKSYHELEKKGCLCTSCGERARHKTFDYTTQTCGECLNFEFDVEELDVLDMMEQEEQ